MADAFEEADREAVYRAIAERRDVRRGFLPQPLDDAMLLRLLHAAHTAPSVGLMQPARFLLIRDEEKSRAVHALFARANQAAAEQYEGEQRLRYNGLKLEGLLEAPQHVCVLCDGRGEQGSGLGRQTMPRTAAYSAVCAIQNLWLAARAEGVGVGWVSIFDPAALGALLRVPDGVEIVGYLCVGYIESFASAPDLERFGWEQRRPLRDVVYGEAFGTPYAGNG